MTESPIERASAACAALCAAYAAAADANRADDFAALFVSDAEFDRDGQELRGQAAIRDIIAGRAPGVWSRHVNRNLRITVARDGRSATGSCELEMDRGHAGQAEVEHRRGTYADQFVLTDAGWRFRRRVFRFTD